MPKPSDTQTPEQAVNLGLASYLYVCWLEGLPEPSAEDLLSEYRRRGAAVIPERAYVERLVGHQDALAPLTAGSYGPPERRAETAETKRPRCGAVIGARVTLE